MPEPLMEILNRELFGGATVMHVVGLVVLILVVNFLWRALKKKDRPDVYEKVRCPKCGWTGEVSKYHKVCRKCGADTLQTLPR